MTDAFVVEDRSSISVHHLSMKRSLELWIVYRKLFSKVICVVCEVAPCVVFCEDPFLEPHYSAQQKVCQNLGYERAAGIVIWPRQSAPASDA